MTVSWRRKAAYVLTAVFVLGGAFGAYAQQVDEELKFSATQSNLTFKVHEALPTGTDQVTLPEATGGRTGGTLVYSLTSKGDTPAPHGITCIAERRDRRLSWDADPEGHVPDGVQGVGRGK